MNETVKEHKLKRIEKSIECDCYECAGSDVRYDEYGKYVHNNLKYHTLLEPCNQCGRPKTEYRDLGRKGYFVCWWCENRAANGATA